MNKAQIGLSGKIRTFRADSLAPITPGPRNTRKSSLSRQSTSPSTPNKLFRRRQWGDKDPSTPIELFRRRQGWNKGKFIPDSMRKPMGLTRRGSEDSLGIGKSSRTDDCSFELDPEEGRVEELTTVYYEKLLKVLSEGPFFQPLPQFPPDPFPSLKQLSEKLAATTASALASMQPAQR